MSVLVQHDAAYWRVQRANYGSSNPVSCETHVSVVEKLHYEPSGDNESNNKTEHE